MKKKDRKEEITGKREKNSSLFPVFYMGIIISSAHCRELDLN